MSAMPLLHSATSPCPPQVSFFQAVESGDLQAVLEWIDFDPQIIHSVTTGESARPAFSFDNLAQQQIGLFWDTGMSALHIAVIFNDLPMSSLLLERGIHPDVFTPQKTTPLYYAMTSESFECAQLLIGAGANLNAKHRMGLTPLHEAIRVNSEALVRLLIEHGADPELDNDYGNSPPELARVWHKTAIHRYLQGVTNALKEQHLLHQELEAPVSNDSAVLLMPDPLTPDGLMPDHSEVKSPTNTLSPQKPILRL